MLPYILLLLSAASLEASRPVLDFDFPDPAVIKSDGLYHVYATQEGCVPQAKTGILIQYVQTKDLKTYSPVKEALPELGAWAVRGNTWAPYVFKNDKDFVMHYAAHSAKGPMCIGSATSSKPEGPFIAASEPMVCNAIDPYMFTENGKKYIVFSRTYAECSNGLFIANLTDDGLTIVGQETMLFKNSQDWEVCVNEAPTLIKRKEKYYLFYSASSTWDDSYKTGYGVADSVFGPYVKERWPIMSTELFNHTIVSPGGEDVITGYDGKDYIFFHGWNDKHDSRMLYVHELKWDANDKPVVGKSVV